MKMWKFVAAAILSAAVLAPVLADAADMGVYPRHARYYGARYWYGLPYPISYLHNYGPGIVPGTFAFYDGPATYSCYQGAATYLGQDRRRHPCF
jgi:hypothetical protein